MEYKHESTKGLTLVIGEFSIEVKARYLTTAERENAKLYVQNHLFVDKQGHPVNLTGIYVMDKNGEFYAHKNTENIFHSSFLSGEPVAGAGTIFIQKGKVIRVDNSSGHYRPGPEHLQQTIKQLKSLGVMKDSH